MGQYYIYHRSFSSLNNEINGGAYPIVKNKSTDKLNLINTNGSLILNDEYDHILGINSNGTMYALNEASRTKGSFDILDIKGNLMYKSNGSYEKNAASGRYIKGIIGSVANERFGLTIPHDNEFYLLDFETQKEVLSKNYAVIKILNNLPDNENVLFELKSINQNLSVYSADKQKIILEDFEGKVEYRRGYDNQTMLLCTNPAGLINIFSLETEGFIYPIWVSKLKRVQGKEHLRILIAKIDEDEQYGIFDESSKAFVSEMSRWKIIEEYGFSVKTKKGGHNYFLKKDGKKELIKLD